MKHFYAFLLPGLLLCSASSAEAAYKSVVVERHDKTTVRVGFESEMKAAISDGNLAFSCAKGDLSFPMSEVNKWTFSSVEGDDNIWSAIEVNGADAVGIGLQGTTLYLRNLPNGSRVALTALDGRTALETVCSDGSFFTVDLSGLSAGLYIVSFGNQSLKILLQP